MEMKKLSMVLSSLLLLNGCLLDQDLGENDQGVNGTGAASGAAGAATGGSSASGGSAGAVTGGSAGSGAVGSGGTATGGASSGGTGAGGAGTGGTGTGGTGTGGTGTGGTGTGGTGGNGGNGTGYDTVGAGLYFTSVKVSGNDVYWSTTGDLSSGSLAYGSLLRNPKTTTWTSGSPIPTGTSAGYIHGAARTLLIDGSDAYVWYSQIMPGWKGGGATKVSLPSGPEKDFLDAIGPGTAIYATAGDNLIAVDATHLYFLCDEFFFDRGICRYAKNPTSGANFELVVDEPPETIRSIGVTATHVYWATNVGTLNRIAIGALPNKEELVGSVAQSPTSLVVDGGDVFVLGTDTNKGTLHLTKFPGGAAPAQELYTTSAQKSGSLVADGTNLYFANVDTDTISRIPKTGGTPTVVVDLSKSTNYKVGDFDVDSANVFFAAMAANGAPLADLIQRAPK